MRSQTSSECGLACVLRLQTLALLLGRVSAWENVILVCGHGGFGITLSASDGEVIAPLIATGTAPEIIRPFFPAGEREARGG